MSDEIQLVLPAEEDFRHIAHLVVGGLGARIDLTFEHLEDPAAAPPTERCTTIQVHASFALRALRREAPREDPFRRA